LVPGGGAGVARPHDGGGAAGIAGQRPLLTASCRAGQAVRRCQRRPPASYTDLGAMTLRLAGAIRRGGVEPGAAVAVLVPDRPDTLPLQLALHLLGCR